MSYQGPYMYQIHIVCFAAGQSRKILYEWHHMKCYHNKAVKEAKNGHLIFSFDRTASSYRSHFEKAIKVYNQVLASYPLIKRMGDMTAKELKEELQKRELKCTGNKNELQQRLRSFLQNAECTRYQEQQNEKLIKGFTREFC
eukprot:438071_1